ncbi:cytochrome c biogenesis protein [Bythopirellula goksoeyrii]|uniref:Cytochrome c biogenesis protein CcsA n=1 Tax=Bythopirellula goksoeyrii TaxID=1400387 RepID=A0A5B9QFI1_9BACT|nr:cytochrome c biogenesis protein CcsA [Bythopirellula goksoeyrii]QEG35666.1 Cytochrome c biogenesis protein CcsA [Bythopirellula goksoeyrii]
MATTEIQDYRETIPPHITTSQTARKISLFAEIIAGFASLRLTVVLFALSIFLILAGTLAQIDHDIWFVVHRYFRTLVAWIDVQIFFPRSWDIAGVFPFPGGWTLGALLGANLLAAHLTRFKVSGSGNQLRFGSGLIVVGILLTYAAVQSGLGDNVRSELSPQFCNGLWHALRAALGASTLLFAYRLALNFPNRAKTGSSWLWWLGAATCTVLVAVTLWLFIHPEAQLDPSGLRILWQLIKGAAAGLVLLAGCRLVFGQRAGIVLLHGGVGLLMFSELHTGLTAEEARMQIAEGQTVNYAEDIRSAELAIVDKSGPEKDKVTVVPVSMLRAAADSGEIIEHPALPFAIRVTEFLPNAVTRLAQPGETTRATEGWGTMRIVEQRPKSTGASTEQAVDLPAAYLELLTKQDHEPLGTYLTWALPSSAAMTESLEIDGKPYEMQMQFKRMMKPYSVELLDFRFDRYVGTETPKNFSSEVRLTDPANHVDREAKIWMNNPLRYGGDTLYQADWDKETERGTVLQVVSNTGWMIPYVACMLVAAGMLYHFGLTFTRFANRKTNAAVLAARQSPMEVLSDWRSPQVWIPALVLLLFVGWVAGRARPHQLPPTEMQIYEFGKLPLAYEGRIQPYDTMARNMLTVLSGKGEVDQSPKVPAIRWLLDVIANTRAAQDYRIIRIENLDVLQTLNLEPRDGFRYSIAELAEENEETMKQWKLAMEVPEAQRTFVQQKFLDLARKLVLYRTLQNSFASPAVRTDSRENLMADLSRLGQEIQALDPKSPRAIPPATPEEPWQIMLAAEANFIVDSISGKPVNEAIPSLRAVLDAYRSGDLEKFNSSVASYQELVAERSAADTEFAAKLNDNPDALSRKTAEILDLNRIDYEAYINQFNPFVLAMALYLVCFVLSACSWLGWTAILNRSANWLLWFTFLLHTYALGARIYISGRPPVTNLYSSAVFIGWAAVLFALVYEHVYRRGLGNLLAAVVGFPTLFIAYNLAGDGDTYMVLQAVLDTQFWLATHVVCITLGYATTILAGMMGLVYVFMALVLNRLDAENRKQLIRMMYGTICFALFFSFVGTVLGGLWADDSWGRFWGWDPKENGALIIVLWNALVLHARWGGMLAHRSLAVLAVFGNVVTAWSWFGVNLMGVGLHSYGFTEGRLKWLVLFVASQLAAMLLGALGRSPGDTTSQEA